VRAGPVVDVREDEVVIEAELESEDLGRQPWVANLDMRLLEMIEHAKLLAAIEPGRQVPTLELANHALDYLAQLSDRCDDLPAPELLPAADGSVECRWSGSGGRLCIYGKAGEDPKARFVDSTTRKASTTTFTWGDIGSVLPLAKKLFEEVA